MNHPNADMRREAIEITKQAAESARILGCNEVVVWSAYDGYDYPVSIVWSSFYCSFFCFIVQRSYSCPPLLVSSRLSGKMGPDSICFSRVL